MQLANVKKVFIVNLWGKSYSAFSKGELNKSFCALAKDFFEAKGCEVKCSNVAEEYIVDQEIEKYQWADVVLYQSPTNWMGMPWEAKKWADDVWTAGMDGRLCKGDGRHKETPEEDYGTGGTLNKLPYMLSLTFNAPKGSFDRPDQFLFGGKNVDDLWYPFHMNNRFFDMEQIPDSTFATFDVMKNPVVEADHKRFKDHLAKLFN